MPSPAYRVLSYRFLHVIRSGINNTFLVPDWRVSAQTALALSHQLRDNDVIVARHTDQQDRETDELQSEKGSVWRAFLLRGLCLVDFIIN